MFILNLAGIFYFLKDRFYFYNPKMAYKYTSQFKIFIGKYFIKMKCQVKLKILYIPFYFSLIIKGVLKLWININTLLEIWKIEKSKRKKSSFHRYIIIPQAHHCNITIGHISTSTGHMLTTYF